VLDAMQQPFSHGGMSFTVTCSIGIALYPATAPTSTSCCAAPSGDARRQGGRPRGLPLPRAAQQPLPRSAGARA
jgi:hypothetical protein